MNLPDNLKEELKDFIDFLRIKSKRQGSEHEKPQYGSAKGMFMLKNDFDAPLDDFEEYMK